MLLRYLPPWQQNERIHKSMPRESHKDLAKPDVLASVRTHDGVRQQRVHARDENCVGYLLGVLRPTWRSGVAQRDRESAEHNIERARKFPQHRHRVENVARHAAGRAGIRAHATVHAEVIKVAANAAGVKGDYLQNRRTVGTRAARVGRRKNRGRRTEMRRAGSFGQGKRQLFYLHAPYRCHEHAPLL